MEHWLAQEYQLRIELFSEEAEVLTVARETFYIPGKDIKISRFDYFIRIKQFSI